MPKTTNTSPARDPAAGSEVDGLRRVPDSGVVWTADTVRVLSFVSLRELRGQR